MDLWYNDSWNFYNTSLENAMNISSRINTSSSSEPFKPYWSESTRAALASTLIIIIIVAILGNGFVFGVVIRNRGMRTRTNLYLCNLAIADLLCATIDMPISLTTVIKGEWIFNDSVCTFNGFARPLILVASVHTLMYTAIHKYVSVKYPFLEILTRKRVRWTIAFSWIWAMIIGLLSLTSITKIEYKPYTAQCGPKYPNDAASFFHFGVVFTTCYFIPVVIITLCYLGTFRQISAHCRRLRKNTTADRGRLFEQQRNITMTLCAVLLSFFICWTPWMLYSLYTITITNECSAAKLANPLTYWAGYLNSACNPIIYGLRSNAFRAGYGRLCSCFMNEDKYRLGSKQDGSSPGIIKGNQVIWYRDCDILMNGGLYQTSPPVNKHPLRSSAEVANTHSAYKEMMIDTGIRSSFEGTDETNKKNRSDLLESLPVVTFSRSESVLSPDVNSNRMTTPNIIKNGSVRHINQEKTTEKHTSKIKSPCASKQQINCSNDGEQFNLLNQSKNLCARDSNTLPRLSDPDARPNLPSRSFSAESKKVKSSNLSAFQKLSSISKLPSLLGIFSGKSRNHSHSSNGEEINKSYCENVTDGKNDLCKITEQVNQDASEIVKGNVKDKISFFNSQEHNPYRNCSDSITKPKRNRETTEQIWLTAVQENQNGGHCVEENTTYDQTFCEAVELHPCKDRHFSKMAKQLELQNLSLNNYNCGCRQHNGETHSQKQNSNFYNTSNQNPVKNNHFEKQGNRDHERTSMEGGRGHLTLRRYLSVEKLDTLRSERKSSARQGSRLLNSFRKSILRLSGRQPQKSETTNTNNTDGLLNVTSKTISMITIPKSPTTKHNELISSTVST